MAGAGPSRESQPVPIGVYDVEGAEPGHDAGQLAHAGTAVVEPTADRVLGIDPTHDLIVVPFVEDRHVLMAGSVDVVLDAHVDHLLDPSGPQVHRVSWTEDAGLALLVDHVHTDDSSYSPRSGPDPCQSRPSLRP